MIRRADLLVIGGGIAGLSTALAAAERQLRVLIVDDARPGAASAAAAGMLAPSLEAHSPAVRAVAMDARDAYPDFLARLRERANIDVALNRHGILELAPSASDLAVHTSRAGPEAQSLDAHELAKAEPAFAGHAGAVLHPKDGSVDNVALMHALAEAVVREPRIDRLPDRVTSLDVAAARPTASTASGERIECARILLASGAWAAGIAGLPRVIPVHPVRGELLLLACAPISHVTYGSGGYLVPRGQTLLIGATSEDVGFESRTTGAGRASLLAIARRAIPALRQSAVLHHWAGLRPVSPDGLPILGADPDIPALLYACGFSRNGILLAPWSAGHLAGLICGDRSSDLLSPFSLTRLLVHAK